MDSKKILYTGILLGVGLFLDLFSVILIWFGRFPLVMLPLLTIPILIIAAYLCATWMIKKDQKALPATVFLIFVLGLGWLTVPMFSGVDAYNEAFATSCIQDTDCTLYSKYASYPDIAGNSRILPIGLHSSDFSVSMRILKEYPSEQLKDQYARKYIYPGEKGYDELTDEERRIVDEELQKKTNSYAAVCVEQTCKIRSTTSGKVRLY